MKKSDKMKKCLIGKTLGRTIIENGETKIMVYPNVAVEKATRIREYFHKIKDDDYRDFTVALFTFCHEWKHYKQLLNKQYDKKVLMGDSDKTGLSKEQMSKLEQEADEFAYDVCLGLDLNETILDCLRINKKVIRRKK